MLLRSIFLGGLLTLVQCMNVFDNPIGLPSGGGPFGIGQPINTVQSSPIVINQGLPQNFGQGSYAGSSFGGSPLIGGGAIGGSFISSPYSPYDSGFGGGFVQQAGGILQSAAGVVQPAGGRLGGRRQSGQRRIPGQGRSRGRASVSNSFGDISPISFPQANSFGESPSFTSLSPTFGGISPISPLSFPTENAPRRGGREGGRAGLRSPNREGGLRSSRREGGLRDLREGGGLRELREGGGLREIREGGGLRANRETTDRRRSRDQESKGRLQDRIAQLREGLRSAQGEREPRQRNRGQRRRSPNNKEKVEDNKVEDIYEFKTAESLNLDETQFANQDEAQFVEEPQAHAEPTPNDSEVEELANALGLRVSQVEEVLHGQPTVNVASIINNRRNN